MGLNRSQHISMKLVWKSCHLLPTAHCFCIPGVDDCIQYIAKEHRVSVLISDAGVVKIVEWGLSSKRFVVRCCWNAPDQ